MTAVVLAALLAAVAVLAWPRAGKRSATVLRLRTAAGPVRSQRRRRRRRARADAVGDALLVLDGIGPALRAGLAPRAALEHLAAAGAVGRGRLAGELAAATGMPPASRGEGTSPVGQVWSRTARESDAKELELVAAAWTLADTCGVPLAEAVDVAAALLRDARARQSRLEVLLAGPRATMSLLTLLPLAGPVVGWVFGVDPVRLYAGSAAATASAALGVCLLVLGRLWCRALVRRALRAGPSLLRSSPSRRLMPAEVR